MSRIALIVALLALLLAGIAQAQEAPTYVVKTGDTLYSIARQHDLTVEELQRLNDLEGTHIEVGQVLVVGEAVQTEEDTTQTEEDTVRAEQDAPSPERDTTVRMEEDTVTRAEALATLRPVGEEVEYGAHVVQEGETLYDLAARYELSADTLRTLNPSFPAFLAPEDTLRLPPSLAAFTHRVEEDETIYDVAATYGVSVRLLESTNDLEDREVEPGQELRIPGRPPPEPEPPGTLPPPDTSGAVQIYPASFEGRLTASGVRYDPERLTASHPSLPFGAVVLLTNPSTERSTFAEIADRGPLEEGAILEVSEAVARQLELEEEANEPVEVRVVHVPEEE